MLAKYASYKGVDKSEITSTPSTQDLMEYITSDIDFIVNKYIEKEVIDSTPSVDLQNGDYGFLNKDGLIVGVNEVTRNNEMAINAQELFLNDEYYYSDANNYLVSNSNILRVKRRVRRIPAGNGKAYGNNILKIEVEVFFPKNGKVPNKDVRLVADDELDSILIKAVKTST